MKRGLGAYFTPGTGPAPELPPIKSAFYASLQSLPPSREASAPDDPNPDVIELSDTSDEEQEVEKSPESSSSGRKRSRSAAEKSSVELDQNDGSYIDGGPGERAVWPERTVLEANFEIDGDSVLSGLRSDRAGAAAAVLRWVCWEGERNVAVRAVFETEEEVSVLRSVLGLSDGARSLLGRILGRKGPWFRVSSLMRYEENLGGMGSGVCEAIRELGNVGLLWWLVGDGDYECLFNGGGDAEGNRNGALEVVSTLLGAQELRLVCRALNVRVGAGRAKGLTESVVVGDGWEVVSKEDMVKANQRAQEKMEALETSLEWVPAPKEKGPARPSSSTADRSLLASRLRGAVLKQRTVLGGQLPIARELVRILRQQTVPFDASAPRIVRIPERARAVLVRAYLITFLGSIDGPLSPDHSSASTWSARRSDASPWSSTRIDEASASLPPPLRAVLGAIAVEDFEFSGRGRSDVSFPFAAVARNVEALAGSSHLCALSSAAATCVFNRLKCTSLVASSAVTAVPSPTHAALLEWALAAREEVESCGVLERLAWGKTSPDMVHLLQDFAPVDLAAHGAQMCVYDGPVSLALRATARLTGYSASAPSLVDDAQIQSLCEMAPPALLVALRMSAALHMYTTWIASESCVETVRQTARKRDTWKVLRIQRSAPSLRQFEAGSAWADLLWEAVARVERLRLHRFAIRFLEQLLDAPYLEHRRGKVWERLTVDLAHVGRPNDALVAASRGARDPSVRGGERLFLQRRAHRLQGQSGPPPQMPRLNHVLQDSGQARSELRRVQMRRRPLNRSVGERSRFLSRDPFNLEAPTASTFLEASTDISISTSSPPPKSSPEQPIWTVPFPDPGTHVTSWVTWCAGAELLPRAVPEQIRGDEAGHPFGVWSPIGGQASDLEDYAGRTSTVSVEIASLEQYAIQEGWRGLHDEGGVLRTLISLLLWDVIFSKGGDIILEEETSSKKPEYFEGEEEEEEDDSSSKKPEYFEGEEEEEDDTSPKKSGYFEKEEKDDTSSKKSGYNEKEEKDDTSPKKSDLEKKEGTSSSQTENPVLSSPGILFWSPWQDASLDLSFGDEFRFRRSGLIQRVLAELSSMSGYELCALLAERYSRHFEEACWGVRWGTPLALLQWMAVGLGGATLACIADALLSDFRRMGGGLPDLTLFRATVAPETDELHPQWGSVPQDTPIWQGGIRPVRGLVLECRFSEVKGPRDSLMDRQRAWIQILENANAPTDLCRVLQHTKKSKAATESLDDFVILESKNLEPDED